MSTTNDSKTIARDLVARGCYLIKLRANSKEPAVGESWDPTQDLAKIDAWIETGANLGVHAGRSRLLIIDVDRKAGVDGEQSLGLLQCRADENLPETFTVRTPSGGRHIFLHTAKTDLSISAGKLGKGLDIRAGQGYTVAPGSMIAGNQYTVENNAPIAAAPEWLEKLCASPPATIKTQAVPEGVTIESAHDRATQWLKTTAPISIAGNGGNDTGYKVFAQLHEIGCTPQEAFDLAVEHWNERCEPPWDPTDLARLRDNGYQYAQNAPGSASPEAADFQYHVAEGTLAALKANPPPPAVWIIPGLLPEGLTDLIAKQKAGKGWLILNIIKGILTGSPILSERFMPPPGEPIEILYLSLEDPPRRLDLRARAIGLYNLTDRQIGRLHIIYKWKPLYAGGQEELIAWLKAHPRVKLVIVDTFYRLSPAEGHDRKLDAYQRGVTDGNRLVDIRAATGVSFIALVHEKQRTVEDFVEAGSGSNGFPSCMDTIWRLTRDRKNATARMICESRDYDDGVFELDLVHKRPSGEWIENDGSVVVDGASERANVLAAIRRGVGTAQAIAAEAGVPIANVYNYTGYLAKHGLIRKEQGLWVPVKSGSEVFANAVHPDGRRVLQ